MVVSCYTVIPGRQSSCLSDGTGPGRRVRGEATHRPATGSTSICAADCSRKAGISTVLSFLARSGWLVNKQTLNVDSVSLNISVRHGFWCGIQLSCTWAQWPAPGLFPTGVSPVGGESAISVALVYSMDNTKGKTLMKTFYVGCKWKQLSSRMGVLKWNSIWF